MSGLRELQLGFAEDLFEGGDPRAGAHIRPHGFTSARRLQVYRNNMMASLTEALQAIYPVIERLVGGGFFRYAAAQYIPRHPSGSGNLHDFGERFPDFLAAFEPAAGLPYLPDVARLEWAYHRVFHAADSLPLDPTALVGVPEDRYEVLRFRLNPACALLASSYPVLRIWEVNQEGFAGDQTVDLALGGVRLLVLRRADYRIEMQALEEGEFALLSALAEGRSFAAACEAALAKQADFDVAGGFRRQVLQGTLVDLYF